MAAPPSPTKLELAYPSWEALKSDFEQNLRRGRALTRSDAPPEPRSRQVLRLVHPTRDQVLELAAEVVWVGPEGEAFQVGLELVGFDEGTREALASFASLEEPPLDDPSAPGDEASGEPAVARNVYERVRALSGREREALARSGSLPERVALERTFGGSLWEALLANPQLSAPEVARIARNGNLPRPLVANIVANGGWISVPEVQRALLSNPRCSGPTLERVLSSMRPADLARTADLTTYRAEVRAAARRRITKT